MSFQPATQKSFQNESVPVRIPAADDNREKQLQSELAQSLLKDSGCLTVDRRIFDGKMDS